MKIAGFWWYMEDYVKEALKMFGQSIQLGLDERKISITELSIKSGVGRKQIYSILNGENYRMANYIKCARVLQVHIEFSLMSAENNIFTMSKNPDDKSSLN